MYKGYQAQTQLQQNLAQATAQNLPGTDPAFIKAFLQKNRMPGVSDIQMARAYTDALVITKDSNAAAGIAPSLSKMRYANLGLGFQYSDAQEQAAIKVAEMTSGSKDPAKLAPMLEHMFKVGTGTGMRVTPTSFLAMVRSARGQLSGNDKQLMGGLDPDFVFYTLETMMQEMGGPQVGRMFGQAMNHIVAGRLTTASAKDFQAMGLVSPGMAEYNKMGMIKRIKPGGMVGSDLAHTNLMDWIQKIYLPHLAQHGVTNWNDIKKHILIDFTNTDSALITMMIGQMSKIQTNVAANRTSAGINSTVAKVNGMNSGQMAQLSASWTNLATAFGDLTGPASSAGMKTLTIFLNVLAALLETNSKFYSAIESHIVAPLSKVGDKARHGLWGEVKTLGRNAMTNASNQAITVNVHNSWDSTQAATAVLKVMNNNSQLSQNSMPGSFVPGVTSIANGWSGNH